MVFVDENIPVHSFRPRSTEFWITSLGVWRPLFFAALSAFHLPSYRAFIIIMNIIFFRFFFAGELNTLVNYAFEYLSFAVYCRKTSFFYCSFSHFIATAREFITYTPIFCLHFRTAYFITIQCEGRSSRARNKAQRNKIKIITEQMIKGRLFL